MPAKHACSLNLARALTSCMTNHNIATSSKHPHSRGAGRRDLEVFLLANWQTCGELTSRSFHHRGPVSVSAAGVCKELFGAALIAAVTHSPEFAIIFFFFIYVFAVSKNVPRIVFFFFLPVLHLLQPRGSCDTALRQQGRSDPANRMLKH